MSCLTVDCPGPNEPVRLCVLRGIGSQLVKISYFKDAPTNFSTGWTAKVTVYKSDGTELFNITSPTRVTLAATNPNIQFQFSAADFTTPAAALGEYSYDVVLTPTVGTPIMALYGPLGYVSQPEECC